MLYTNNNKKYEYFIKKVVDFEEIGRQYDDGWECYKATAIDLYDFLESWIPGMKQDGL